MKKQERSCSWGVTQMPQSCIVRVMRRAVGFAIVAAALCVGPTAHAAKAQGASKSRVENVPHTNACVNYEALSSYAGSGAKDGVNWFQFTNGCSEEIEVHWCDGSGCKGPNSGMALQPGQTDHGWFGTKYDSIQWFACPTHVNGEAVLVKHDGSNTCYIRKNEDSAASEQKKAAGEKQAKNSDADVGAATKRKVPVAAEQDKPDNFQVGERKASVARVEPLKIPVPQRLDCNWKAPYDRYVYERFQLIQSEAPGTYHLQAFGSECMGDCGGSTASPDLVFRDGDITALLPANSSATSHGKYDQKTGKVVILTYDEEDGYTVLHYSCRQKE